MYAEPSDQGVREGALEIEERHHDEEAETHGLVGTYLRGVEVECSARRRLKGGNEKTHEEETQISLLRLV